MARKRKSRKRRQKAQPAARKRIVISRKAIVALVVLLILGTCFMLVRNYLLNSPEFIVSEVELRGEGLTDSYLYTELVRKGADENIFSVDVRDIEHSIKSGYFEVKDLRVEKVLPDKLIFHIDKRIPIALIGSRYYYPVDADGMILKSMGKRMREGLPLIRGINVDERDVGKVFDSVKLVRSLELLRELSASGLVETFDITSIDAASSRNLSFYIDGGVEVKMGGNNFKDRLINLKKVLGDPEIHLADIRYIDLRFKDVVVGPK